MQMNSYVCFLILAQGAGIHIQMRGAIESDSQTWIFTLCLSQTVLKNRTQTKLARVCLFPVSHQEKEKLCLTSIWTKEQKSNKSFLQLQSWNGVSCPHALSLSHVGRKWLGGFNKPPLTRFCVFLSLVYDWYRQHFMETRDRPDDSSPKTSCSGYDIIHRLGERGFLI